MSLKVPMMPSIASGSTMLSGRWSLISEYVRKPRSLPDLIRALSFWRRSSSSSSLASVSDENASFSSAFSLALRSLALALSDGFQFGALDRVQGGDFVVFGREFLGLATTPPRHLDGRQHVARRVDRGEGFRIGRLADWGDTRNASFRLVLRIVRLGGRSGGFGSHFGFGFLGWHRRFRSHND
jgi:hypothetical protein